VTPTEGHTVQLTIVDRRDGHAYTVPQSLKLVSSCIVAGYLDLPRDRKVRRDIHKHGRLKQRLTGQPGETREP